MADLLLVDDDADVAELCAENLRAEGHSARVARNGTEGLARLGECLPDLVLLDVEMPVLTGPDMAYRMFVENLGREAIPVLLLSGVADLRRVAARVGTPYFLAKPFTLDALLGLIRSALEERKVPVRGPIDRSP